MIAVGCDHGGFALKEEIVKFLRERGYEVKDLGCHSSDPVVDYPEYSRAVSNEIIKGTCEKGILFCGTGLGISIAANKIKGIRAAVCTDTYMARMSREHNDANILTLGGRVVGTGLAVEIVDVWLKSEFIGGVHKTRVDQICSMENE